MCCYGGNMRQNNKSKTNFVYFLNNFLKKHNITNAQLAKLLDVNRSTVTNWRQGHKLPCHAMRDRLAQICAQTDGANIDKTLTKILHAIHTSEGAANGT